MICPFCNTEIPTDGVSGDGECKCGALFTTAHNFGAGTHNEVAERMIKYLLDILAGYVGDDLDEPEPEPGEIEANILVDVLGTVFAVFARPSPLALSERAFMLEYIRRPKHSVSPFAEINAATEYLELFSLHPDATTRMKTYGLDWLKKAKGHLFAALDDGRMDRETH